MYKYDLIFIVNLGGDRANVLGTVKIESSKKIIFDDIQHRTSLCETIAYNYNIHIDDVLLLKLKLSTTLT